MTEMREARIVMPEVQAVGSKPHDALRAALCEAFGGFTMTYGVGGWVDDTGAVIRDNVCIYDVAMERTLANYGRLRALACEAGRALGQRSVYLRYPSGSTAIISLEPSETAEKPDDASGATSSLGHIGDLSSVRGVGLQVTEESKAIKDALLYGAGFTKGGKHVPVAGVSTKRLPQAGEIWLARDGLTVVAVLKQATLLDGGFDCVTLTRGSTALKEGYQIVVDLDGRYIRGVPQESHPLDLVTYRSIFLA